MRRAALWLWRHGIVSTFMTGLFVVLPLALTIAIMGWAASMVVSWIGPGSPFGQVLHSIGLGLLEDEETSKWVGTAIGWVIVILGIWLLGAIVKNATRQGLEESLHRWMERIPVISAIYKPVSQVVSMLKKDDKSEMQGMTAVYCQFGDMHGGGFLALLTSNDVFQFGGQASYAVYIPTSPIPMSGGIIFVPVDKVTIVDMSIDELMQIYFSLGVMAPKVVPEQYQASVS